MGYGNLKLDIGVLTGGLGIDSGAEYEIIVFVQAEERLIVKIAANAVGVNYSLHIGDLRPAYESRCCHDDKSKEYFNNRLHRRKDTHFPPY